MKVAICTLGCKVNQYETQAMEQELTHRGHEIVDFSDAADVYVVNTCSVTAVSDKKSRQMLRRAKKSNPDAIVAACGCYAQTHRDEVETLTLDVVGGTGSRMAFIDDLERAFAERQRIVRLDDALRRREFELLPPGGLAARTRAMMKVEDGCVNFCTYCIIPYARGGVRSLPLAEAAKQAAQLCADGYREIVITGIEISSYGHDLKDGTTLIDLLETIAAAAPTVRLRLGSLEPRTITREFCARAAKLEMLCPHFHLSLQSGCDATLRRMNRKYDTARFMESVSLLREYFDAPAVTTDLIVGFPEETEGEFTATLAFIRACGFADMHIFPYSPRPDTPAAKMQQIAPEVKTQRAERAAAVAAQMHEEYLAACVGRTFDVLFEQEKGGRSAGHAPNYMEVCVDAPALHNVVRPVRITKVAGENLLGVLVEGK